MIKEIKMIVRPPVSSSMLISWERIHGLKLPSDLKNYYSSTNGFRLTWSLDYADEILKVGEMSVNTLQALTQIETDCIELSHAEQLPRQDSRNNPETFPSISFSEIHKIFTVS
jgi:tubulin polyglutamylase complex subunit 2